MEVNFSWIAGVWKISCRWSVPGVAKQIPCSQWWLGTPKPTFLEVFIVNNLVVRWPKPLFFMVSGAHGNIWGSNWVWLLPHGWEAPQIYELFRSGPMGLTCRFLMAKRKKNTFWLGITYSVDASFWGIWDRTWCQQRIFCSMKVNKLPRCTVPYVTIPHSNKKRFCNEIS